MIAFLGRQKSRVLYIVTIAALAMCLASCATQPPPSTSGPPGFFSGLLHGFLIVVSFIVGLFTDYRIYAFPNSGGWYDFGYLIGVGICLGGGGASAR